MAANCAAYAANEPKSKSFSGKILPARHQQLFAFQYFRILERNHHSGTPRASEFAVLKMDRTF